MGDIRKLSNKLAEIRCILFWYLIFFCQLNAFHFFYISLIHFTGSFLTKHRPLVDVLLHFLIIDFFFKVKSVSQLRLLNLDRAGLKKKAIINKNLKMSCRK